MKSQEKRLVNSRNKTYTWKKKITKKKLTTDKVLPKKKNKTKPQLQVEQTRQGKQIKSWFVKRKIHSKYGDSITE